MNIEDNILDYIDTKILIWYGHLQRTNGQRWDGSGLVPSAESAKRHLEFGRKMWKKLWRPRVCKIWKRPEKIEVEK